MSKKNTNKEDIHRLTYLIKEIELKQVLLKKVIERAHILSSRIDANRNEREREDRQQILNQNIIQAQYRPPVNTTISVFAHSKRKRVRNTKPRDKPVFSGTNICVGDKVEVLNPKINQAQEGTVIGVTKSGFVEVDSGDDKIINWHHFLSKIPYPRHFKRIIW